MIASGISCSLSSSTTILCLFGSGEFRFGWFFFSIENFSMFAVFVDALIFLLNWPSHCH